MPLLEMRNIDKVFFGQYANRDVDLAVESGEIHALLGENGAGKTTLMNILYGIYTRDGGQVLWQGRPVEFASPRDAIACRIGMVHQHFMLVPTLTVSQNITLGLKSPGYPFSKRKALNEGIMDISRRYGLKIDPEAYVSRLSVGEQQRVEIIKLLYRNTELLILDEPTAVLTPQETQNLFAVLRRLKDNGCSVILITHRIPEVMEIADRVTVLRDARKIITAPTGGLTEKQLSEYMIGRELRPVRREGVARTEGSGLTLSDLCLKVNGVEKLDRVSLDIAPGEILGLAGVDGNGQKELAEAAMGIRKPDSGRVLLAGEDLSAWAVDRRIKGGLAYISDDRHHDSLVMPMSLMENLLLKYSAYQRFVKNGFINMKVLRRTTEQAIRDYEIKTLSAESPVSYLSGGNQQKLILARELTEDRRAIVALQPTRGLDIGASEFVQNQLLACKRRNCAILLISADLEEVLSLSDRIAVIHDGAIMGVKDNTPDIDVAELGLMMAGRRLEELKGGEAGHGA